MSEVPKKNQSKMSQQDRIVVVIRIYLGYLIGVHTGVWYLVTPSEGGELY